VAPARPPQITISCLSRRQLDLDQPARGVFAVARTVDRGAGARRALAVVPAPLVLDRTAIGALQGIGHGQPARLAVASSGIEVREPAALDRVPALLRHIRRDQALSPAEAAAPWRAGWPWPIPCRAPIAVRSRTSGAGTTARARRAPAPRRRSGQQRKRPGRLIKVKLPPDRRRIVICGGRAGATSTWATLGLCNAPIAGLRPAAPYCAAVSLGALLRTMALATSSDRFFTCTRSPASRSSTASLIMTVQ